MVVKIRVPFWVLIIIRHLIFRVPKRGHNFDNYPYGALSPEPSRPETPKQASPLRSLGSRSAWELSLGIAGLSRGGFWGGLEVPKGPEELVVIFV